MMKKVIKLGLVFSLLCCLLFPLTAAAQDEYGIMGEYKALILDDADLLSDEEEQALMETMFRLTSYGNVIFSTVVLPDGADFESNCEDVYYSFFGNQPGVNFQIDMGNRKLTLSASTDVEDAIYDERESIVDNVYRLAGDGDYLGCAAECFDEIYIVLNDGRIAHSMKYIDNACIAVIAALILNFYFAFQADKKAKKKMKRAAAAAAAAAAGGVVLLNTDIVKGKLDKIYDPQTSSSSGSSSGGSSGSSSGGGGGGFSGGSSSHGF